MCVNGALVYTVCRRFLLLLSTHSLQEVNHSAEPDLRIVPLFVNLHTLLQGVEATYKVTRDRYTLLKFTLVFTEGSHYVLHIQIVR